MHIMMQYNPKIYKILKDFIGMVDSFKVKWTINQIFWLIYSLKRNNLLTLTCRINRYMFLDNQTLSPQNLWFLGIKAAGFDSMQKF